MPLDRERYALPVLRIRALLRHLPREFENFRRVSGLRVAGHGRSRRSRGSARRSNLFNLECLAVLEPDKPAGQAAEVRSLGDHHDRDLAADRLEKVEQGLIVTRANGRVGIVKQHQFRIGGKRPHDRETLSIARRQHIERGIAHHRIPAAWQTRYKSGQPEGVGDASGLGRARGVEHRDVIEQRPVEHFCGRCEIDDAPRTHRFADRAQGPAVELD